MKVILLERVQNLGRLGDVVEVRAGYGRNYLVPEGKAVSATPANLEAFQARREELAREETERLTQAQARAAGLADFVLEIAAQAGEDGRLFGSVGTHDISDALNAAGHPVDRAEVRLPEGPLKRVGDHPVKLHLHPEVDMEIVVRVNRA